ncbi:MAG: (2Fe-2S)-binding protein [Synechococcaceae cyanobacterium SM2_3_1]|nr:(2Fe-2S)-binding protein [Synechococcaceae cyanobacterium SM2_3_1]
MPNVTAQGKTFGCDRGANLRDELTKHDIPVYNGKAETRNCGGNSLCGTCSVLVEGAVSPPTISERIRLSLPPLNNARGLRLSCQTKVLGYVRVTKFDGFWGQGSQPLWTPER